MCDEQTDGQTGNREVIAVSWPAHLMTQQAVKHLEWSELASEPTQTRQQNETIFSQWKSCLRKQTTL